MSADRHQSTGRSMDRESSPLIGAVPVEGPPAVGLGGGVPAMTRQANGVLDHLVSNLAFGRIRSVAFVVRSDVPRTLPLYDLAIATARRGWRIGIEDVHYWFVTPEPEPLASLGTAVSAVASQRLEPEGITFIGSTYADVRDDLVLLDPQRESIEVDVVVSLDHIGGFDVTSPVRVGLGRAVPMTRSPACIPERRVLATMA
jgi:hypothetical protein